MGADGKELTDQKAVLESLEHPSADRIFHIKDAFIMGISFRTIQKLTKMDKWFLHQIQELAEIDKQIQEHSIESLPKDLLILAKQKGYADRQIAHLVKCLESQVYEKRKAKESREYTKW